MIAVAGREPRWWGAHPLKEAHMPKFLIEASYTAEGFKGLQKDKAAGRTAAVRTALKAVDGELECLYWCLGDRDVIAIVEFPNTIAASAFSSAITASGLVRTKTTALLTGQEMDASLSKTINYHPPGR
jgi:uncharacterized protein with GYD domain